MMRTKDIHLSMNQDNPVEELMSKFSFATEEELYAEIRRITPQGSEDFIRRLKKKSRRARTSVKPTVFTGNSEVQKPAEITEFMMVTEEPYEDEKVDEFGSMLEAKQEDELEQLRKDEHELSEQLCELEAEHKEIMAKRSNIVNELSVSRKTLVELRSVIKREEKKVVSLCEEYNGLAIRMQEITRECNAHRELLEDMRDRISELEKVYIFVFEDGTIEVENAEMVSVSGEEVVKIVNELIKREEAEEVMFKDIKNVAKIKLMISEYERSGLKLEVNFGNPKVEKLFGLLE